jgi:hypothetical protein
MPDDFLAYGLIMSVATCAVLIVAYVTLYSHVRRLRDEYNVTKAVVRVHNEWLEQARTLLILHHAHLQPDEINDDDPMNSDFIWESLHPLLLEQLSHFNGDPK